MKIFRETYLRNIMILITGITFLNMSFFLAEISALKLDKNSDLIENIAKLVSGGCFEEERESGESAEADPSKELAVSIEQNLLHHQAEYISAQQRNGILNILLIPSGYLEIFSPPPESI